MILSKWTRYSGGFLSLQVTSVPNTGNGRQRSRCVFLAGEIRSIKDRQPNSAVRFDDVDCACGNDPVLRITVLIALATGFIGAAPHDAATH